MITSLGTLSGGIWTPSSILLDELTNDPVNLGYKNTDGSWKTASQIGALLTSPIGTVTNPVTVTTLPKPVTIQDLVASAPNTIKALPDADLEPIAARVRAGDRDGIQRWADVLLLRSAMSQTEHDAVTALLAQTITDPNYQATVPGPSRLETLSGEGAIDHGLIKAVTGGN